jgi:hypothetical protein
MNTVTTEDVRTILGLVNALFLIVFGLFYFFGHVCNGTDIVSVGSQMNRNFFEGLIAIVK